MRTFVLQNFSEQEDGTENYEYTVIEESRDLAKSILQRRKRYLSLKAKEPQLHESYYLDGYSTGLKVISYGVMDESLLITTEEQRTLEGSYLIISPDRDLGGPDDDQVQNIEVPQMVIGEDGVKWTFVPKHHSHYVYTATIPYGVFEKKS